MVTFTISIDGIILTYIITMTACGRFPLIFVVCVVHVCMCVCVGGGGPGKLYK